ncbi:JmjC domain-containing protein [Acinetobacter baumannii]|uniref:JmjC domain-containing protein n=1 Tax=Acinetobacter baumannii TaxID=470 RepID=UPI00082649E8|nr:cupin domain-containing protein [Acinetobacter baumannii]NAS38158.1 cupin domain-containing protein [Acinetobacter baumannii]TPS44927.1 cupin domain-containing protein [Acinetobacter baumannii]HAV3706631.1 cupin domain-containing protein [Acinetobacter baumannii]HDA9786542.1 cupin-like domain-containing protein [Acinetobacter baumannii]
MILMFEISKKYFQENILYKKPFIFKSCFFNEDISWEYINEIYSRADFSHRNFKLMNGYEVPKKEYIESYKNVGIIEYKCIEPVLYEYLRSGATLVHNRITNEPKIDNISRQIANFANAQTITSGYAAFSSKSSYKSHWDTRDVYAVQLIGKKRWIIKAPNFPNPLYMQQTKHFTDIEEPDDIYMDIVLEPGDVLYIPRGWWHNPLPLDGETFHLAIGTFPPTGFEYTSWIQNLIPNMIDSRKNLTNFNSDISTIESISNDLKLAINNKENYESFMMDYLGQHRTPSILSLDKLGNNKITSFEKNQKLFLNANLLYLFDNRFLVINGNKIKIDEISLSLIKFLFENQGTTLSNILEKFNDQNPDKINKLIFNLAIQNVISVNM